MSLSDTELEKPLELSLLSFKAYCVQFPFLLLCVTLNLCVCFDHGLFARFCMSVCSQLSGRGGSLGFPPPIISWKSQHAVSWNSYLFCQFCITSKLPKLLPRFRLVSPNCKSPTHLLLFSTSSHFHSCFSFPSRLDFSPAFVSQFLCLAILSSHNGEIWDLFLLFQNIINHWPWMRLKIRKGRLSQAVYAKMINMQELR